MTQEQSTLESSLLKFEELLLDENKRQNLFARSSADQVREKLIAPCQLFADFIEPVLTGEPQRLLDLGAGGGLPGIVLALRFPNLEISLCDSTQKKCRFLEEVSEALELKNTAILHNRVEKLKPPTFDLITARFFGKLSLIEQSTRRIRKPGTRFFLFKGSNENLPQTMHDMHLEAKHAMDDEKVCAEYLCR
jgi:16S rRNA (guanine527-N7)-methyltransferase